MRFEEKNTINIPIKYKCFVYFLIKDDIVVYVGQTKNGLTRPFSHKDKEYNKMEILLANEKNIDLLEDKYITKYKPKYNKMYNTKYNISLNRIKKELNINLWRLKKIIKDLNINIYDDGQKSHITIDDYNKIKGYIGE